MKKIGVAILITCSFLSMQCEDDIIVDDFDNPCDDMVIVDANAYQSVKSDSFQFTNVEIDGDCLIVSIAASGCSGENWSMTMIDSGAIAESSPEQRFLKFEFLNPELCLAVVGQEVSFNLTDLQIDGSNEIILNLEGWDNALTYSY